MTHYEKSFEILENVSKFFNGLELSCLEMSTGSLAASLVVCLAVTSAYLYCPFCPHTTHYIGANVMRAQARCVCEGGRSDHFGLFGLLWQAECVRYG